MLNNDDHFKTLYQNFNDRKIEEVLKDTTPGVKWANGMEGGYVYGRDKVKAYWSRQFLMVSAKVTPLEIGIENGRVKINVHQVVHDMAGNLLSDSVLTHYFTVENNLVAEFNIGQ